MNKSILITAGCLFLSVLLHAQQKNKERQPNILIIFSDDHAYQAISAYGSKWVQTPNIDRIAKDGAVFKNVFVTNSLVHPVGLYCLPVSTVM